MREDVQKVQDKVPVIGDIPICRTSVPFQVDQHLKRNLIIFVTARLINPAGEAIRSEDEEEEVIAPLTGPEKMQPAPPELPYAK